MRVVIEIIISRLGNIHVRQAIPDVKRYNIALICNHTLRSTNSLGSVINNKAKGFKLNLGMDGTNTNILLSIGREDGNDWSIKDSFQYKQQLGQLVGMIKHHQ